MRRETAVKVNYLVGNMVVAIRDYIYNMYGIRIISETSDKKNLPLSVEVLLIKIDKLRNEISDIILSEIE